ncbi:MAG: hypothetical protein CM15mP12_5000 [Gammaproteobacteria bacterium]|nr:MAG: hypothetical protein CM15mP12_5000 [Gammaproteobacteria bacterium]
MVLPCQGTTDHRLQKFGSRWEWSVVLLPSIFRWQYLVGIFCLAAVCGNSIIWKPSPHTEGCAKLMKEIWDSVAPDFLT